MEAFAVARRCLPFALLAALGAAASPPPAGAGGVRPTDPAEPVRVGTLRVEPRAPTVAGAYEELLSKPPGWVAGDPAVVLLWEGPGRDDPRDRVVLAALDEGAAVLELDAHAARGVSPDSAFVPPPLAPSDLLPDLFAALNALRREARAGAAVVAIGYGTAGGAALGPGRQAFAPGGAPPDPAGHWDERAKRLCAALAAAMARGAAPADAVAADCAAAFAPRSPDPRVARAGGKR
jgi:hypothetical protein